MNLGENHTASHVFPPPSSTLSGALRTSVLIQNGVSFVDYGRSNVEENIIKAIGKAGEDAPFDLIGPLFLMGKEVYVPAPYSWFMGKDSEHKKVSIVKGRSVESRLLKSPRELVWVNGGTSNNMISLGGKWIKVEDLNSIKSVEIAPKSGEYFFENEVRTGIALEEHRAVREGHLYSFNHARLKRGVSLLFGVNTELPLADKGVLKIGAERRFGWYEKVSEATIGLPVSNGANDGGYYSSLSNVEGTEAANSALFATGQILYFGGWDLKVGFHKPMKGFFPAGTVFTKKINNNCIAIKD